MQLSNGAQELWAEYWVDRSDEARNALIEHYMPLVKFTAIRLGARFGKRSRKSDVEELIQFGVFGMRDAIRGFDLGRGVKFETYCVQRVRGAMLDGLKSQQWVPREIRQRTSRFIAVHDELQAELGPGFHAEAAASRIGVDESAVDQLRGHASRMLVSSLQANEGVSGEEASSAAAVADYREEDAPDAMQRQLVRELMFRELTRIERHLVMLYYYENMTMREIGEVLGISGTRVSQLHSEIMIRLRERLRERVSDENGRTLATLQI